MTVEVRIHEHAIAVEHHGIADQFHRRIVVSQPRGRFPPDLVRCRPHDLAMSENDFTIQPISDVAAAAHRADGGEIYVADSFPGYPCRQCLQDAPVGDELILVSHDPFSGESPYRSASPIFLHRETCASPSSEAELPKQLTRRQLSVRAFDAAELMIDAAVIDGADLGATITGFFKADATRTIHVHNASRGCWAVSFGRTVTPSLQHS